MDTETQVSALLHDIVTDIIHADLSEYYRYMRNVTYTDA
jgi:hypothetical protein